MLTLHSTVAMSMATKINSNHLLKRYIKCVNILCNDIYNQILHSTYYISWFLVRMLANTWWWWPVSAHQTAVMTDLELEITGASCHSSTNISQLATALYITNNSYLLKELNSNRKLSTSIQKFFWNWNVIENIFQKYIAELRGL